MSRQNAVLNSATQQAMAPELGGQWGPECLNTRLPLPILLYMGYRVRLKKFVFFFYICKLDNIEPTISTYE